VGPVRDERGGRDRKRDCERDGPVRKERKRGGKRAARSIGGGGVCTACSLKMVFAQCNFALLMFPLLICQGASNFL
jgi:hypothetical protein